VNADVGDPGDQSPNDDDIRVEYHPSSGREPEVSAFEDFVRVAPEHTPLAPPDPDPWTPFNTREDFEFAELALETGMSKAQVNRMIDLFHKCIEKKGRFTLSNHAEMRKTLEAASERLPKVCL